MKTTITAVPHRDLARTVLGVLFIGGLIGFSFWILRPFLGALVWAVMIVVATWPLLRRVERAMGGRRWLAVTVMTLVLIMLLIVPFCAAIVAIVTNTDVIMEWVRSLRDYQVPPPPSWLHNLPAVGERLTQHWQEVAVNGVEAITEKLAPYATDVTRWFVAEVGSLSVLFIQFLLIIVLSAILYASGEAMAQWACRFGARLAGQRGEGAVRLSGQAIRGVALGIVVTAVVQSLLGGICLLIAGVPFATLLTALMFMLAVAQIGPLPVLIPAILWLYSTGATGAATFLLIASIPIGALDNILRPILIKQGADLPLLLIFAGVIGGLMAFGLIGIFIGPMALAVSHALLNAWMDDDLDRTVDRRARHRAIREPKGATARL